jgi:hypothetical protein
MTRAGRRLATSFLIGVGGLGPKTAEHETGLLGGRATGWIEDARSPPRSKLSTRAQGACPGHSRRHGIEAWIWLTDIAGLSSD